MSKQPPSNICTFAQNSEKKFKVPTCVQLAQWIDESGWGAHSPGNNPFGMKPRKGMNDPSQTLMTNEEINGKLVKMPQPFRIFPSLQDAFDAHAQLLSTAPVYQEAFKALPDVNTFITLMAKHYATDSKYGTKIIGLIKSQGLNAYDLKV